LKILLFTLVRRTNVKQQLKSTARNKLIMPNLNFLIEKCQKLGRLPAAIVDPRSEVALSGALQAYTQGILEPILVGPQAEIEQIAKDNQLDISALKIVNTPDDVSAAAASAQMASNGEVHCLVKGSLHTDIMMHAVLQPEYKLRTKRLISSCCLMHLPTYNRLVFLADMVMNIAPTLEQKVQILENAVDMARALGWEMPKVAIIAAVEVVNLKMPATVDAAIIAKMADRGQIENCIVDGPIDLDIAISPEAAKIKHFKSPIMGDADILIMPDLQAANALYKEMIFMGKADAADVILGASVPIIVTSRADDEETRLHSIAAAALIAHNKIKRD
jgi:phosphate acetyltransferase/phosphate butyryltransferase